MKAFLTLFFILLVGTVLWRVVFTRKKDRKQIRSVAKEAFIAIAVASVGATALFFALFNNTLRII